MAMKSALLITLMCVALGIVSAQTTVDWKLGQSYTSYSTQSFKTGATIVFNYDSTHNVLVVSKSDYDNCNTASPIQKFTDGKTTITLKQGASYFICGVPGHCSAGMKLQVNAAADSGSSTPATPTTPSTTTPTPDAGSSTPTTPSAPSPKGSSGASAVSSVFGLSLAMGALFAFLC
ncbi:hypothetical protein vseg_015993 [Gypsophila vaccaria]